MEQANKLKDTALDMLDQARHDLDEANRSKSDFMCVSVRFRLDSAKIRVPRSGFLCHELRNPLHAIYSMAEFLASGSSLVAEDRENVNTIVASVSMMRAIVVSLFQSFFPVPEEASVFRRTML